MLEDFDADKKSTKVAASEGKKKGNDSKGTKELQHCMLHGVRCSHMEHRIHD